MLLEYRGDCRIKMRQYKRTLAETMLDIVIQSNRLFE